MDIGEWENRVEQKIDKLVTRMGNVDVTLAKQHVTLTDHIRRTNILEAKIIPLEERKAMFDGILKLIGGLGVVAGIITGGIEVFNFVLRLIA